MKSLHGQPPQAAELAKGLNGMAAEPDTDGVATSGLRTLAPAETAELLHRLRTNVASVLLGKPDLIQLSLVALLAEGHLLLEDVPGVGKTLLGKALARSLDCRSYWPTRSTGRRRGHNPRCSRR
jgi:hypothetical protein